MKRGRLNWTHYGRPTAVPACTVGLRRPDHPGGGLRTGRPRRSLVAKALGRTAPDPRGACKHPDGAVGLLESALRALAWDFDHLARHGRGDATVRFRLQVDPLAATLRVCRRTVPRASRARRLRLSDDQSEPLFGDQLLPLVRWAVRECPAWRRAWTPRMIGIDASRERPTQNRCCATNAIVLAVVGLGRGSGCPRPSERLRRPCGNFGSTISWNPRRPSAAFCHLLNAPGPRPGRPCHTRQVQLLRPSQLGDRRILAVGHLQVEMEP